MRARPCRRHSNQGTCNGAAMHAQPECSIKLAAAPQCEAEADAMCVLVSAAGAPTKALAGVFAFVTEPP